MVKEIVLPLIASLLLIGCSTPLKLINNEKKKESIDLMNNGVIAFRIDSKLFEKISFFAVHKESGKKYRMDEYINSRKSWWMGSAGKVIDGGPEVDDELRQLFLYEAPAGTYSFVGGGLTAKGGNHTEVVNFTMESNDFVIKNNEITYVGDFNVYKETNILGGQIVHVEGKDANAIVSEKMKRVQLHSLKDLNLNISVVQLSKYE